MQRFPVPRCRVVFEKCPAKSQRVKQLSRKGNTSPQQPTRRNGNNRNEGIHVGVLSSWALPCELDVLVMFVTLVWAWLGLAVPLVTTPPS